MTVVRLRCQNERELRAELSHRRSSSDATRLCFGIDAGLLLWRNGAAKTSDVVQLGGFGVDGGVVVEQFLDRVPAAGKQGFAGGIGHFYRDVETARSADAEVLDVDGDFGGRIGFDGGTDRDDVGRAGHHAGHREGGGVAVENFRERLGDDAVETVFAQRLWGVFAGRAAAEVDASDEDRGLGEARVVERVLGFHAVFVEADVIECEFAEAIEGDAFHETRRDDAIGVDICAGDENSAAGDGRNGFECHDGVNSKMLKNLKLAVLAIAEIPRAFDVLGERGGLIKRANQHVESDGLKWHQRVELSVNVLFPAI